MNGTEADYAKKRCHKLIGATVTASGPNNNGDSFSFYPVGTTDAGSLNCIGSSCAGWTWTENAPVRRIVQHADKHAPLAGVRPKHVCASWDFVPFDPDNEEYAAHWIETAADAEARRHGKCGVK